MNHGTTMTHFIRLDPTDNVITLTAPCEAGVEIEHITTRSLIPNAHKCASQLIKKGEAVRKYAQIIGYVH